MLQLLLRLLLTPKLLNLYYPKSITHPYQEQLHHHNTTKPIPYHISPHITITTIKMSSTQTIIKAIEAIIKEISALPPVKEGKITSRPQPSSVRPSPVLANGWGNFAATIKANDKAAFEDRQAKAAAFAASGQEQYTITEVYKNKKF
jgi:hypothetical protein